MRVKRSSSLQSQSQCGRSARGRVSGSNRSGIAITGIEEDADREIVPAARSGCEVFGRVPAQEEKANFTHTVPSTYQANAEIGSIRCSVLLMSPIRQPEAFHANAQLARAFAELHRIHRIHRLHVVIDEAEESVKLAKDEV